MIRREEIIEEELITRNQKIKDCILINCKIEEGTLIQTSKIIVDGEVVSRDCNCLKIEEELEEEIFNSSFESNETEESEEAEDANR